MTDHNEGTPRRGWVLYDEECSMCTALVARVGTALRAGGFSCEPLQSPWVRERLALAPKTLLAEIRVLTIDGRTLGGADAVVYLAREIGKTHQSWRLWLLTFLSKIPFGMRLLRHGYRWVAARRYCRQGACVITMRHSSPRSSTSPKG